MTEHEKINAINTVVKDWFAANPGVPELPVKELMPLFIEKGVFPANHRDGLPIRDLLRQLDAQGRLNEIPSLAPERKAVNTNWYFKRPVANFRGETYPRDIGAVITDMQHYIKSIDEQLNREEPFYIKDFITSSQGRNTKNINSFVKHFDLDLKKEKDIKGVYVLARQQASGLEIMNVGISRTIIRRLYQHSTGKKHNESTLGFYMAQDRHRGSGNIFKGKRQEFPYDDYRDKCLDDIRNLRFALVRIDNNFELYMAEIYLACHYKAYWNTFETH